MKWMFGLGLLSIPLFLQAEDAGVSVDGPYQQVLRLLDEQGIPFKREDASFAARDAALAVADPDARVLTSEQADFLRAGREGAFFGPGLRFRYKDGAALVSGLRPDSPAATKGVKIGDVLTAVNGADVTRQRFASVYVLLRSRVAGGLKLAVRTPSKTVLEYDVVTRGYRADAVEFLETFPSQLGYIRVNGLYSGAGQGLLEALTGWSREGSNGVVLDLRDAGGGDVQAVAEVASLFSAPDELLFTYRNHAGKKLREYHGSLSEAAEMNAPMMILVNKKTHGAAELLAAVLAVSGRGVMVVGETTSGNPGVREFVDLPSGEVVWLAVKTVTLADGSVYSGDRGITPDVLVSDVNLSEGEVDLLKQAEEASSDDPRYRASLQLKQRVQYDALLQRAVDILLGLKALNIHLLGR